jgi:hypothetical protein
MFASSLRGWRPRWEARKRNPTTNEYGTSDSPIVPEKFPNNARNRAAEVMEESGLAKENPLK